MAQKRNVDEVLPRDAVHDVRGETPLERITRLLLGDINRVSALLIIVLGLIGSLVIMMVSDGMRTQAFQLFSTIVSGALGFFFATKGGR